MADKCCVITDGSSVSHVIPDKQTWTFEFLLASKHTNWYSLLNQYLG